MLEEQKEIDVLKGVIKEIEVMKETTYDAYCSVIGDMQKRVRIAEKKMDDQLEKMQKKEFCAGEMQKEEVGRDD